MASALEARRTDDAQVAAWPERTFVSIVIPCLNEERTIAGCVTEALAGLTAACMPGEIIVCDNGSTDRSAELAVLAGARLVHCPARGYGNAVRCGVQAARGRVILMGDGDGSYDFSRIGPFVAAMIDGAQLVVGNRFQGGVQAGAMPWLNRRLGTPLLTALARRLFAVRVGDVNCGLRGFTREAFEAMSLRAPGMELASEMIARAALVGLKIVEVPTVLRPDGRGRPSHLRPWRDGMRHLRLLASLRLRAYFTRRAAAGASVGEVGSHPPA